MLFRREGFFSHFRAEQEQKKEPLPGMNVERDGTKVG